MSSFKIGLESAPQPADVQVLTDELAIYAAAEGLSLDAKPLAVFLRSRFSRIMGGVYGVTYWGLFWIQMVWVEESLRGQGYGTELMWVAEQEALRRGCYHARLETFAPEALDFYRKLGYEVLAELTGHPPAHTTYFMKKSDLTLRQSDPAR